MIWNPAAESMARGELERLQLDRLRESLTWTESRVPFYREQLNRARIVPEAIQSLADVSGRWPAEGDGGSCVRDSRKFFVGKVLT